MTHSEWVFPKLEHPSVFIGSPSDVGDIREAAKSEFRRLQNEVADMRGVELYAWEDELFKRGWDQNRPYQASIPLTNDLNCRAVIFIFGERIGATLPFDFPTHEIINSPALSPETKYSLSVGSNGENQKNSFSLTGSTFEYLVAQTRPEQKVLFLILGDETIKNGSSVAKQNWGTRKLLKSKQKAFGDDNYDEFFEWYVRDYLPQLEKLRNFYRYITQDRNTPVDIIEDEQDARDKIRAFLIKNLDLHPPETPPFKYLEAYSENDRAFYGRKHIREEIVEFIQKRIKAPSPKHRPFFCIYGASGSGKSSILRAGVISHLSNSLSEGNWVPLKILPSELIDHVDQIDVVQDPLVTFYTKFQLAIGNTEDFPLLMTDLSTLIPEYRPKRVLENLILALKHISSQHSKETCRLILGIDQFEECLSDLNEGGRIGDRWNGFLEFLDLATQTDRMAVICTVPQSWFLKMDDHPRLKMLVESGSARKVGFPLDTVEEIIDRSYALVTPSLSSALREKLLCSINELVSSSRGDDQGAILPLLSLAMSRIYERWRERDREISEEETTTERKSTQQTQDQEDQQNHKPTGKNTGESDHTIGPEFGKSAEDRNLLSVESYGDIAQLKFIIEGEAEAALIQAKSQAGSLYVEDECLPDLLRSMISLLPNDEIVLRVVACPADPGAAALLKALQGKRLISEVGDNRFRFVHERVIRLWPRANNWVNDERRRFIYVHSIKERKMIWERDGRDWHDPRTLERLGVDDTEGAAEVVYAWAKTLSPVGSGQNADQEDAETCDLLVAIVAHQASPRMRIKKLKSNPTHLHAAAAVGSHDLLHRFVMDDPECVHLTRESDNRTALFEAAFFNRTEIINTLINAGVSPDQPDSENWFPLHAAAVRGRVEAGRTLLSRVSNIDEKGGSAEFTPFYTACLHGHMAFANLLLENGAKIDPLDTNEWSPLHSAARNGQTEMVAFLLQRNADPTLLEKSGWSPFHLACRYGDEPMIRLFLADQRTNRSENLNEGWTPLQLAIEGKTLDAIAALLSEPKINREKLSPRKTNIIDQAIYLERMDILELLLSDDQVDPEWKDSMGHTALYKSAKNGSSVVVKCLLQGGASIETRTKSGDSPLHIAAQQNALEVAGTLVEWAPNKINLVNNSHQSPLHIATQNGHRDMVEMLINQKANLELCDEKGVLPVHLAAGKGEGDILALFLAKNKNFANAEDQNGNTPAHYAAIAGHSTILQTLREQNRDVVRQNDKQGNNVLHIAVKHNQLTTAQAILDIEPELLNIGNEQDWEPLHIAAQFGHIEMVKLLLENGADPNRVSGNPEMTFLQIVAEVDLKDLVSPAHAKGADLDYKSQDRPCPLLIAISHGHFGTAIALLDMGATVNIGTEISLGRVFVNFCDFTPEIIGQLQEQELRRRLIKAGITIPDIGMIESNEWPLPSKPAAPQPPKIKLKVTPRSRKSATSLFENYPWQVIDEESRTRLTDTLTPVDGRYKLNATECIMESTPLPWYEEFRLLRIISNNWESKNLILYYLIGIDSSLFRLNGTSPPIHEVNAKAPIRLNESNVLDYLRFFTFFVRGKEGAFYFIENMQDSALPVQINKTIHSIFEGCVRPLSFQGKDDAGNFLCDGVIWYSNALFIAKFKVLSMGMIEMLDDEPIAADLPIRLEAPIS